MAAYVAESDTFAGWSTGRNFGYFGLLGGAVGLTGWAALHGRLPGLMPTAASDQLFLWGMEWVGGGLFALMAIAVLGSLIRSSQSRGTVVLDDVGVTRRIGGRSRMLRWDEIEGMAPTPYGGVTLVSREGDRRIEIPRFLDDYRGCIAELRARNLANLPASRLKRKGTWQQWLAIYAYTYTYLLARDARVSHAGRIASLCIWMALFLWTTMDEKRREDRYWIGWLSMTSFAVLLAWLLYRMAHTW